MKSIEEHGSSFVVRIWLEPREVKGTSPEWRGRVEHVQTGERVYFRGLDRMIEFMMSYLGDSGGACATCREEARHARMANTPAVAPRIGRQQCN